MSTNTDYALVSSASNSHVFQYTHDRFLVHTLEKVQIAFGMGRKARQLVKKRNGKFCKGKEDKKEIGQGSEEGGRGEHETSLQFSYPGTPLHFPRWESFHDVWLLCKVENKFLPSSLLAHVLSFHKNPKAPKELKSILYFLTLVLEGNCCSFNVPEFFFISKIIYFSSSSRHPGEMYCILLNALSFRKCFILQ